jgi:hypothetical protein
MLYSINTHMIVMSKVHGRLNVNETQTVIRDQVDALGTYRTEMTRLHKFALYSIAVKVVMSRSVARVA